MADYPLPLANQTAAVTGASSGIGRATAITFATQGADLIIHAHTNHQGLEETADAIRALNRQVTCIYADLTCPNDQGRCVDEAFNAHPLINIWVNNAGCDILTGEASQWTFEQKLNALWELDVRGTIGVCRHLCIPMAKIGKNENAVIINMGWDQAETGQRGDSGQLFAPAKAAVMAYSRSLARELAPQVRVNCLAPGWIQTAWGADASSYWDQRACAESLMQRWGTPHDVAVTAAHIAAPAASFITGQVIQINGGLNHEHIPPLESGQ
ncbi:MAG: SDR family oxidoreductase [Planctomycetota bacterium]|nr:SDR family oxidoreductase [Planctomycetota bacterium]